MKPNKPKRNSKRSSFDSRDFLLFNRSQIFCLFYILIFITIGCEEKTTKPAEVIKPAGPTGLTKSLHKAAVDGSIEQVKLFISKGADISTKDDYGQTALHCAVVKGHNNITQYLLENGAEVDPTDNAGRTPLHYASGAGGAYGVIGGDIGTAQLLLDKGANINATDKWGWTPLHYATRMRNKDLVELLVNRGADSNIPNKRGHTAFSMTRGIAPVFSGHDKQIEFTKRYHEIADFLRHNGNVYCVAVEGNDFHHGTLQRPFKTLGTALAAAEPGDLIFVRGGVYTCLSTIYINKSGQSGDPICIKAYPGETPLFDFSKARGVGLDITGAYLHIEGLTVTKTEYWGIRLQTEKSHHNILEQITAHTNGLTGIALFNGAAHNLILNCDSYQNFDPEINGENADGFNPTRALGQGNIFIGCRAWNNSDDGFDLWSAVNSVKLERCYAWRNGKNIWGHPCFTGNANGFKLGRGGGRHVLVSCLAWGHSLTGFNLNGNTDGVTLRNCTAWNNYLNYAFNWSNFSEEAREDCVFINNVSYNGNRRDGIYPRADSQHNTWDAYLGLALTKDDFLSLDDSKMSAPRNPDGSIPKNNFLKLAPTSNIIDKGVDIGMPFVGEKPDLGSFEYDPNEGARNYVKMLHQYVRDHNIKKINEILSINTDINDKDWLGYAPLHWACYFGYADIAKLLLDSEANLNLISDTGRTPLEIAKTLDFEHIAELLRKHGARE